MSPFRRDDIRLGGAPQLTVELVDELADHEMAELCEATDAAIIEGGGFGWVEPQGRAALERHFRGVLLVPERELLVARLDGHVAGSVQLVRPPRYNEAQAFGATLTHAYIAPYARGHGLARLMIRRVEERAAALGHRVLNLDVRETQRRWATPAGAPTRPTRGCAARRSPATTTTSCWSRPAAAAARSR